MGKYDIKLGPYSTSYINLLYVTSSDWCFQIDETGQKNAVLTLYELSQGDLSSTEEFREMDPVLLRKVLQILVKRGVATIFKGADGEETGVKFFGSSQVLAQRGILTKNI